MENMITIKPLLATLTNIRRSMLKAERHFQQYTDKVQPHYHESSRNLIHYLALRSFDLQELQYQLSSLGLSSLSHSERYTRVNVENILFLLRLLNGGDSESLDREEEALATHPPRSRAQLISNTLQLFGPEDYPGHTRLMVTLPLRAAEDPQFVQELLLAGMKVARINTSHDSPSDWLRMIHNLRQAEAATSKPVLLYMDLQGPKIRTGEIPARLTKKGKSKRGFIRLRVGDQLDLVRQQQPASLPVWGSHKEQLQPGSISISLPEVLDDLKVGHTIWFDDGKFGGLIEEVHATGVRVRITSVMHDKDKLFAGKGINLPETQLRLPALTQADLDNLPLVCANADMLGLSFVRKEQDIEILQEQLDKLGKPDIGIIIKVETQETFNNLPTILLRAMRSPRVGLMIARGDLAVELGFIRIAEVQEQLMWLCEAAHVPVIWATQILENLVTKGAASRAEISDVVLSVRAECAMLNKGPYILDALHLLQDIDRRMAQHQSKKQHSLKPLGVARHFMANLNDTGRKSR